ncbi:MAG: hypothetical protein AAF664_10525 [Planctomycetota bacterium]
MSALNVLVFHLLVIGSLFAFVVVLGLVRDLARLRKPRQLRHRPLDGRTRLRRVGLPETLV